MAFLPVSFLLEGNENSEQQVSRSHFSVLPQVNSGRDPPCQQGKGEHADREESKCVCLITDLHSFDN